MAYSALAVANAFIEQAKAGKIQGLTPMKLQKLLFYTQSWHLKQNNGAPLMDDHFARWKYGPVIPSLYHELKSYGSRPITALLSNVERTDGELTIVTPYIPASDTAAHRLIEQIIKAYGSLTGTQLSNLSHEPGTAWALADPDGSPIAWDEMAEHIHPENRFA